MTIKERRKFYATLLDKVNEQLKELKTKNPCRVLKRIISVDTEQYHNEIERLIRIRNRIDKSKKYWNSQYTIGEAVKLYTGFAYISGCCWEDTIHCACDKVGLDVDASGFNHDLRKKKIAAAIFALMEAKKHDDKWNGIFKPSKAKIQERIEELKILLML